jgi:hypothetical protein
MSEQGWPEFPRWYELTMEEQRIYAEEDERDHNRLLDAVDEERRPLETTMLSRTPQTFDQLAMLATIELRYAEKRIDANIPWVGYLSFGTMQGQGADLIEGVLRGYDTKSSAGRRYSRGGCQCLKRLETKLTSLLSLKDSREVRRCFS